jgi:hypothetical protein
VWWVAVGIGSRPRNLHLAIRLNVVVFEEEDESPFVGLLQIEAA